ncbi:hypothetical protein [Flavobacterium sp. HSC-61S13]|uniref:hypothetical protein n=1 Tax=Flavobacterium sp. HSC-61S13 TaxID=2910963 RepID=UPI0020A049AC|nr:hypothetical protein [Flavobacterium sp. HSC-61S13]MCP1994274.1 hypothetical protein [Flavobacterium sp. HSC-61S13]
MSTKVKTFLLQFISFAVLFFLVRVLIVEFTALSGFWIPLTSAVVATILAPQFRNVTTADGDRILMKWIFMKGVKTFK